MKKNVLQLIVLAMLLVAFAACEKESDLIQDAGDSNDDISLKSKKMDKGFVHGLVVDIDGEDYYFFGPPDGNDGAKDVPGHYWVQAGKNKVVGKHYNTGPFGTPYWWSSDAEDGAFLYIVHGIIDTWSHEKATYYAERGYVHRHEFVKVSNGEFHPNKVVWLKHTAVTSFTLDGGPGGSPTPPYLHDVTPGVDLEFPNNGHKPYPED